MCLCSETELTRAARQGEELTIRFHDGHYYHGNVFVGINIRGQEIACVKSGHRVQFINVPRNLQLQHLIAETAVATFRTNHSDIAESRTDQFVFDDGRVTIALNDMPAGTRLTYLGRVQEDETEPTQKARSHAAVRRAEPVIATRANLGEQTMTFAVRGRNPMASASVTEAPQPVPTDSLSGRRNMIPTVTSVGCVIFGVALAAMKLL